MIVKKNVQTIADLFPIGISYTLQSGSALQALVTLLQVIRVTVIVLKFVFAESLITILKVSLRIYLIYDCIFITNAQTNQRNHTNIKTYHTQH